MKDHELVSIVAAILTAGVEAANAGDPGTYMTLAAPEAVEAARDLVSVAHHVERVHGTTDHKGDPEC